MTTKEAYLLKVMEECDELSQRISKAIRFGLEEIQEGQELTNKQRIIEEYTDLKTAMKMVVDKGYIEGFSISSLEYKRREDRINKYMEYSKKLGIITD